MPPSQHTSQRQLHRGWGGAVLGILAGNPGPGDSALSAMLRYLYWETRLGSVSVCRTNTNVTASGSPAEWAPHRIYHAEASVGEREDPDHVATVTVISLERYICTPHGQSSADAGGRFCKDPRPVARESSPRLVWEVTWTR